MLQVLENEPLAQYTTFNIGGKARFFVLVKNENEIKEAIALAKEKGLRYFVFSGGSNIIFSDNGFDGLVIKIDIRGIEINETEVMCGAGEKLLDLVHKTIDAGLSKLENLAGIPGSLGGAVCVNAGAYGSEISDILTKAELIYPDGKIEIVESEWFDYQYRYSKLKYWKGNNKPIILRAWLTLEKGDIRKLKQIVRETIEIRNKKLPAGYSAGSIFENIKGKQVPQLLEKLEFTSDERERFGKFNAIPSAWFIEHADLQKRKMGGIYISDTHNNYLMNDGTGTAEDIGIFISYIKQQVRNKFSVQLEAEVQIVE